MYVKRKSTQTHQSDQIPMSTPPKNLLYAQSGGVTAVINCSAAGVIATARKHKGKIGRVYAAKNGIVGALREELFDTTDESYEAIKQLAQTPGGAFGSCRYKLKDIHSDADKFARLLEVFAAHDIGYFLYNGGNDSADTANKIAALAGERGLDLICVGVPKTIDNDLAGTDVCPGFPSAAKFTAISVMEATLDVRSMAATSTKVFVYEAMGRHAGWLAAAGGLAERERAENPQLILFPEVAFDEAKFLAAVQSKVDLVGFCTVIVSEGIKDQNGAFLTESGLKDAFGHSQLGGAAQLIADLVKRNLKLKVHYAIPDYLQRSARHIASRVDADLAYKVGEAAVRFALERQNAVMPVIKRTSSHPYRFDIRPAALSDIANHERTMPPEFISADGFGITTAARRYLQPLIAGEAYPSYVDGLPSYVQLKNRLVRQKLAPFEA
jgi:ATP-dependent phosphofructokinase / diphosphate-dependent phosphofructokinase